MPRPLRLHPLCLSFAAGLAILALLAARPAFAACDLSGSWRSTLGIANILQQGAAVSGVVAPPEGQGRFTGAIAGSTATVTWSLRTKDSAWTTAQAGTFESDETCTRLVGTLADGSTWKAARLTGGEPPDVDPAALAAAAEQLRANAAVLDGWRAGLARSAIDVAALARKLGPDPMAALDWVRGNVALVDYRGALKGAVGALAERRANPLDRALLLADVLAAGGHQVRLAKIELSGGERDSLYAASFPHPPPELSNTWTMADLTSIPALDPTAFVATAEAQAKRSDAMKADLAARANNIATALATIAAPLKLGAAPPPAAATAYWWVQVADGDRWIDLDPGGAEGAAPRQAAETVARDALPDDVFQTVELKVSAEFTENGKLREVPVLIRTLRVADLAGVALVLRHQPLSIPQPDDVYQMVLRQKEFDEGIVNEGGWVPELLIAGVPEHDQVFLLDGTVMKADPDDAGALAKDLAQNKKFGIKLSGGLDAITGALAGEDAKGPPVSLTAVYLDVTIGGGGETARVERRAIYDRLSAAERAAGGTSAELTAGQRLDLALALTSEYRIDVNGFAAGTVKTTDDFAADMAVLARAMAAALEDVARSARADPGRFPTEPNWYSRLWNSARWSGGAPDDLYIGRPQVSMHRSGLLRGPDMSRQGYAEFDIVFADLRGNKAGADTFMRQGVADTLAEGQFVTANPEAANTALLFEKLGPDKWLVLKAGDTGNALLASYGAKTAEGIRRDLAAGYAVVAPKPGAVAGLRHGNWWRVDLATGAVLGMGESGAGQGLTEYANLLSRSINLGICAVKGIMGFMDYTSGTGPAWRAGMKMGVAAVCLIGHGMNFYKDMQTWAYPGGKFPAYYGPDYKDNLGLLGAWGNMIGVIGTLVSLFT